MANCAWLAPKPRNAPHDEVVGAGGDRLHVDGRHVVRPGGVAGGPLEHLHPDRGVGAGVADGAHPDRGEHAVGVAAGPVLETDRVALGVHAEALLARQRALHRAVEQPGGERGLRLVAHVLLAAERPAVGHQLDDDPVGGDVEHAADVVAVVPHALAAGVDVQRALVAGARRHGERRLRLEEGVLDALGLEHLVDGVGARRRARRRRRRGRRRCATARCRRCPTRRARRPAAIAASGSVTGGSTS